MLQRLTLASLDLPRTSAASGLARFARETLVGGRSCLCSLTALHCLADDGGGTRRLAVFSRKSIPSKTQTGPIEGVITSFKNELYFLSQIAYSAKNLRIFILEAPVTSPQEQNIELIAKEFAYTYE
ncbi:hypothetical protein TYRP_023332 [Tyrophagus putrescentiae]|nr:hypothetical protein TYRP_023332 [Tyrophagus putrescentiae]